MIGVCSKHMSYGYWGILLVDIQSESSQDAVEGYLPQGIWIGLAKYIKYCVKCYEPGNELMYFSTCQAICSFNVLAVYMPSWLCVDACGS